MIEYTKEKLLRVAKRFNNKKRTYLLVNPLQAKHLPVAPSVSMEMMRCLGEQLAFKYPNTKLIIGFAETATAIGAVVAECFGDDCVYVHTTRETFENDTQAISFQEEHSHAVEQMLYGGKLDEWLAQTDTVLFVEDEISTGKTMINIVNGLKERYPALREKQLAAASLLNRVSDENAARMEANGIVCEYLVKLPEENYTEMVADISVTEAPAVAAENRSFAHNTLACDGLMNPRMGVKVGTYKENTAAFADTVCRACEVLLAQARSVLVLGTEECMYPALKVGYAFEQLHKGLAVSCHATTRSPIGVSQAEDYPVTAGCKLPGFYDAARTTYLYNLKQYDLVFIVSDTRGEFHPALCALASAFAEQGSEKIYLIQGDGNVWYV
ncbi:MAG: phosphoribosyltransferase domain-containing protein [Oscillospiraceae bacterium]|nr:phosphoribosyltransferase domain-containing protein [Oscillospiraceae bacterium]